MAFQHLHLGIVVVVLALALDVLQQADAGIIRWAADESLCLAVHEGNKSLTLQLASCQGSDENNKNEERKKEGSWQASNLEFKAASVGPIHWATHPSKCVHAIDSNVGIKDCLDVVPTPEAQFTTYENGRICLVSKPDSCLRVVKNGRTLMFGHCPDQDEACRYIAREALYRYSKSESFVGRNFFDHFHFNTGPDPTHGQVQYVDEKTASEENLIDASGDSIYIGADLKTKGSGGRKSVRIESKVTWTDGLFVVSLNHVPIGCGTWPAMWLLGENPEHPWPNWGEYDIIEGTHNSDRVMTTLHTGVGCNQQEVADQRDFSGQWAMGMDKEANNCDIGAPGQWGNQGCMQWGPQGSLGQAFNENGGGTYAAEWAPEEGYIRTWFWPAGHEPDDLLTGHPDPGRWPQPYSFFRLGAMCPPSHFRDMRLIFDLTFCGDLGRPTFAHGCPKEAAHMSCEDLIRWHPELLQGAFWSIKHLDIYRFRSSSDSSSSTSSSSSSSSSNLQGQTASAKMMRGGHQSVDAEQTTGKSTESGSSSGVASAVGGPSSPKEDEEEEDEEEEATPFVAGSDGSKGIFAALLANMKNQDWKWFAAVAGVFFLGGLTLVFTACFRLSGWDRNPHLRVSQRRHQREQRANPSIDNNNASSSSSPSPSAAAGSGHSHRQSRSQPGTQQRGPPPSGPSSPASSPRSYTSAASGGSLHKPQSDEVSMSLCSYLCSQISEFLDMSEEWLGKLQHNLAAWFISILPGPVAERSGYSVQVCCSQWEAVSVFDDVMLCKGDQIFVRQAFVAPGTSPFGTRVAPQTKGTVEQITHDGSAIVSFRGGIGTFRVVVPTALQHNLEVENCPSSPRGWSDDGSSADVWEPRAYFVARKRCFRCFGVVLMMLGATLFVVLMVVQRAPECGELYMGCRDSRRCCNPSHTCYEKNEQWAACLPSCRPGIHFDEEPRWQSPWSCEILAGPALERRMELEGPENRSSSPVVRVA